MGFKNERNRIREIISVFLKHGVSNGVKGLRSPERIREALEELGPTFVKIGQILSIRPDLLPEPFIREFGKLQDNVKPEKLEDIRRVFESDLGKTPEELFADFDTVPAASASLAQVHLAVLNDGRKVAVKIQRPKAGETILKDIAIFKRLGRFIKHTPQGSILNIEELMDELYDAVKKELDFLVEAKNIKKFFKNNADVRYIECPTVYDKYTTSNILVMDYIEGIKIGDTEQLLDKGYVLEEIGSKLASNYFKQVFEDGFFHADPHPGNIIISGGSITYIDFGIMGTLNKDMKDKFNKFLYGVVSRDVGSMSQALLRIGVKKGKVNINNLHSDIEDIYNKYIETSLFEVDLPRMINDIFKICRRNSISMPRDITMLMKGIMTIEGVAAKLSPETSLMEIAAPYVRAQIFKDRDYRREALEQLESLHLLLKSGVKIPVKLLELISSIQSGKLKIHMELKGLDRGIGQLNRMVNRIVFGIIASALIIGSSLVMNNEMGPKLYGISAIGIIGYTGAVIMGFWLLLSIIKSGKM